MDQRLEALFRSATVFSAADIARVLSKEFGVVLSRNSVIGRMHRLGFTRHTDEQRHIRQASRRKQGERQASQEPKAKAHATRVRTAHSSKNAPDRASEYVELVTVEPEADAASRWRSPFDGRTGLQCKWPVGDPGDKGFRFCVEEASRGAYCADHGARAYRPPKNRGGALTRSLRRYI